MKPILIIALLLFASIGCKEKDKTGDSLNSIDSLAVAVSHLAVTVDETQVSFYLLGRSSATFAALTLVNRRLVTGQGYTVDELYALSDSVAKMKGRIK